jgi:GH15 family glucan-1,4-alpha-glucosidase
MFGLFPIDGDEMKSSVNALKERFAVTAENPGVPRYENETYRRQDENGPSNPWYITSLWLAQYYLEIGDKAQAHTVLEWVQVSAGRTGVIGEQTDPVTHEDVSVAPLSWSQAEYVSTLLDTITVARDEK